jgi:hypothetical protein
MRQFDIQGIKFMSTRRSATTGLVLASISAAALLGEATVASAQPYDQAPPPGYDQNQPPPGYDQNQPPPDYGQNPPPQGYDEGPPPGYGPPQGQYAPPPGSAGSYDSQQQQYDQDYAARYSAWAARYCIDRRNNNVAAGSIIGGVLGSIIGSGIAGRGNHFAGAVVGGAVGATAGGAIGASSSSTYGCPPGYVVAAGAPAFAYGGPVAVGPGWYNPWVWYGGQWTYRPYRSWYYRHPGYWRGHRRY